MIKLLKIFGKRFWMIRGEISTVFEFCVAGVMQARQTLIILPKSDNESLRLIQWIEAGIHGETEILIH